jgi:uncharacterized protein with von Willebrand factor type A (vWA) domain
VIRKPRCAVKTRLLTFAGMLRDAGLPISVGETLDAVSAVGLIGVEREALRDGLATTLLKDQADRPAFDATFDQCFPLTRRQRGKGPRPEPTDDGDGRGMGASRTPQHTVVRPQHPRVEARNHPSARNPRPRAVNDHEGRRPLLQSRRLQTIPFERMSPRDIEDCDALVASLAQRFRAHMSRHQRQNRRGRLDIRRTIRWSIASGGVPLRAAFRQRRPGAPDLVGLCDHSHSVATASRFLISLLHPAQQFFRRVRLFAFVDQPIEISIDGGMLVPHGQLDFFARSDFGNVLARFWEQQEPLLTRNTIVLILGDARNNRRPPRAAILARLHRAARHVAWLNPEPMELWNTGDSVMNAYRPHCDEVFSASTLRELLAALQRSLTRR